MAKFGWIWKNGRGERSPVEQKESLEDEGVPSDKISDEWPRCREGDTLYACYVDVIAGDPEGLCRRFSDAFQDGGSLYIVETDREYTALPGMADLMADWLAAKRRWQTHNARQKSKGRRKQAAPAAYLKLSDADKLEFARLVRIHRRNWRKATWPEIARKFGMSPSTAKRAAKVVKDRAERQRAGK